ncbi:MAG TPA: exosortase A [Allosphingosinicella sp.]|jgi:exosortase A|nr:exosortase A [Allosphingosinicella sp.]
MTAVLPVRRAEPLAPAWRAHLAALGAASAAILLLFARDFAGMAAIWWKSATFNHCFLVGPIIAWLVWQRLPELGALAPRAWAPGLALVAAGGAGWLLGEAGNVALFRHFGLVLMLQGAAVACLGKAVSRGIAFPIFYAVFLVPFGDELVPPLQTLTAEMSMALLALTGVPAHIDGIFISTPSGLFRVAEACSGVRFLVAMAALGALAANLCFRSWPRRLLFVAFALAVSVLANGVRAFGTIYIAWWTDNEVAVGIDHIVYGWIFFAIVIALIMAAGWRFFDRAPNARWFDPADLQALGAEPGPSARSALVAAIAVFLAAAAPLWSGAVAAAGTRAVPDSPLPEVPGWTRLPAAGDWQPRFSGADRIRLGRYRNAAGQQVDLAIVVFARQSEGRELVGYGQGAADEDGAWSWTGDSPAPADGKAERIGSHGKVREVVSFYRVGQVLTGSSTRVKLETVRVRLLGGAQRAVAVLVSAEAPADGLSPRPAIDAFLEDLGPVAPLADRAAGLAGD